MDVRKEFDCVDIKNEIQERFQKEYEGLNTKEIREKIEAKFNLSNSPIALFWRKIRNRGKALKE